MNCVRTVAKKPMHSANTSEDSFPKKGVINAMRNLVIPLSSLAMAWERGITTARMRMIPHVTPESTIVLNRSSGLPSTLRRHITVTRSIQMPVFPMVLKKRAMPDVAGRMLGKSSRTTSANRNPSTILWTLFRRSAPSVSRPPVSSEISFFMSGLNTYLAMTMNSREHSAQHVIAMIMYFA